MNKTRNECHSDRRNVSRGIYSSSKFYFVLVPSPTWWIPPLRGPAVGMTKGRRFYGFAHCLCNILRRPAALISLAHGGSFCTVSCGTPLKFYVVISETSPGTAHRPFPTVSLMGIFFNRRSLKTFVFCSLLFKLTTSVTPITVNCQLSTVNDHVHCYLFVDKCPPV